jgi:hypothetical protein
MTPVRRWDIDENGARYFHESGDFVLWQDHEIEIARLLSNRCEHQPPDDPTEGRLVICAEYGRALAEVERLTVAREEADRLRLGIEEWKCRAVMAELANERLRDDVANGEYERDSLRETIASLNDRLEATMGEYDQEHAKAEIAYELLSLAETLSGHDEDTLLILARARALLKEKK